MIFTKSKTTNLHSVIHTKPLVKLYLPIEYSVERSNNKGSGKIKLIAVEQCVDQAYYLYINRNNKSVEYEARLSGLSGLN